MGKGETLDRSATRMPMILKLTVAISIVLAAIGYGAATMTAHSSDAVAEADARRPAREVLAVPRPTPAQDAVQPEEDPRPCEPERGVTERCTY